MDTAYIQDAQSGREFITSASIHVNANQTFNDGKYGYEKLSVPFVTELGRALIESEGPAGASSVPLPADQAAKRCSRQPASPNQDLQ